MIPLPLLALGAAAVYFLTRKSESAAPAATASTARPPIIYQLVRKLDWLEKDPGQLVTSASDAQGFYIIARDQPRGSYHAWVEGKLRSADGADIPGFYDITKVVSQLKSLPPLDIIPNHDIGWLFVPERDASGKLVLNAEGKEIWHQKVYDWVDGDPDGEIDDDPVDLP